MKSIDIHQGNVVGLGAKKFTSGIVQHLLGFSKIRIETIYIHSSSRAIGYGANARITFVNYLFGGLSRIFEICFWRYYRRQENELLVLGDLPLNTLSKQFVLCHQSLMFKRFSVFAPEFFKFALFRFLFRLFLKRNDVVLVQSQEMAKNVRSLVNEGVVVEIIDLNSSFFGWPQFYRKGRRDLFQDYEPFELIYLMFLLLQQTLLHIQEMPIYLKDLIS